MLSRLLFSAALVAAGVQAQCNTRGPTSRVFYSMAIMNNDLYLSGGSKSILDVWKIDLSQGLDTSCPGWQPLYVQPSSNASSLYGPFMFGVMVPYTPVNQLMILGGDYNNTPAMSNGPVYFDLANNSFVIRPTQTNYYSKRSAMSVTMDNSGVAWIYSGRDPIDFNANPPTLNVQQADYYQFNMTTDPVAGGQDAVASPYGARPPRYAHTTTLVNNKLFTLGGYAMVNKSNTMIDFASAQIFDIHSKQALAMATIGDIPEARAGFSAVPSQDGQSIIVFGGMYANKSGSSEVHVLDTCTLTWSSKSTSGAATSTRLGHTAWMYGKYMVTMLGAQSNASPDDSNTPPFADNVAVLDTSSWTWVSSIPKGYTVVGPDTEPACAFQWPADFAAATQQQQGTAPTSYDPTVLANPNANGGGSSNTGTTSGNNGNNQLTTPQKGGIGIGVPLFLIACGALAFYMYRRNQKKKARPANPRWTGILAHGNSSRATSTNHPQPEPADMAADYPLATVAPKKDLRTYTAADHDQWEQQLMQSSTTTGNNQNAQSRHDDIWAQMRGMQAPADEERR
ncbi:hypothetical protein BC940DRAFT_351369 [Gongronella butleri]|nr:hypothetical protein BC940DRAFT_351369 [Gongronella butleri]